MADRKRFSSPGDFAAWCEEVLVLEKEAEEEETTELLRTCSQAELQSRGIAILRLRVAEQSTALYGRACVTLERSNGELPAHKISHGDIVGLFDQSTRPLSKAQPLASAVVTKIRAASLQLAFDGDVAPDILDGRPLNVALISSDVTLRRYKEALELLKASGGPADSRLLEVCFGDAVPRVSEVKSEDCGRLDAVDCSFRASESSKLNEPQQAAVVQSLLAQDVAVVHGPPGTGKTTTLVAYIQEAVARRQRLLVTAPSNVAVDNLLERLAVAGCRSLVRLGHPARVQESIQQFTMDNVVYGSEQAELCRDIKKEIDDILKKTSKAKKASSASNLKELRSELRSRERHAVAEVLRSVSVVFATCTGAATLHRELRRHGVELRFDVVVIDEAAQALEVACWIPLMLGRKAVLAGDHQQLAACVKSPAAQQRGLDVTLFGRLIEKHPQAAALLSIQYRSNEVIMGWSSRSFYSSRLLAAECVASQTLSLQEVPSANITAEILEIFAAPMLFVDTGGLAMYLEDGESSKDLQQSRCNVGESRFVLHYFQSLVQAGVRPQDITVITPYNRQVEQLRLDFESLPCRISTVDSFQGQEADVVLISLVRSNKQGTVGFLSDFRRLNVAVTRARKQVMIVGDASTICKDQVLSSLYEYACEAGRVVFVQQLLDEEGQIPLEPVAAEALQAERARALAKPQAPDREAQREAQRAAREAQLRRRFEAQLAPLAKGERQLLELPRSLNAYERAMAHEVAEALKLLHESKGEGSERRLYIWRQGAAAPEAPAPVPCETALEAFEGRAKALLESLGPGKAAEWKNPSEEEVLVLRRLAEATDVTVVEDKRRFQVQVPAPPKVEPKPLEKENQPSMLAQLHAEKLQRREKVALERAKEVQKAQGELKQAKKAAKKEKAQRPQADDDDLDALLLEFTTEERSCSFAGCKEKINTLMDAISKCRHCSLRFCLSHAQAEVHGCGDAARRAEQKRWKESCAAPGPSAKASGESRGALASKLQEKVKEQEAGRAAKKKGKK